MYTKLSSKLLTSTVWQEDDRTRIVWITMLALADTQGRVAATVPGLANMARVSVEATRAAIGRLMAPDPWSRTPDSEGRRIEKIDGGWRIINFRKFNSGRDAEIRREQNRQAQARWRERRKQEAQEGEGQSAD
jgi:hypothetical protein